MLFKVINSTFLFIFLLSTAWSQNSVEDIINLSKNEIQISRSDYSETDYRICNRNSHIILTALQHRFSFNDNFVNSVVYSSNDYGINWRRALLENTLNENERIIAAQAPVVAYHNDIAYHAFLIKKYISNKDQKDSISQSVLINSSTDNGVNWNTDLSNGVLNETMPVDNRPGEGLLFEKSNLDLFNYNNSINCIYLEKEIFKNNEYSICLKNLLNPQLNINKINIPDEFLFIGNLSYLVKDDILKIAFVGLVEELGIFIMDIDLRNLEIISYNKITNIFFKGSYNIPGSLIDEISSVNSDYLSPTPKMAVNGNEFYCIFSASGIDEQEFDLNIYLSKSFDSGKTWMSPRIVNSERDGSQFYPSINVKGDTLACSWIDTKETEESFSSVKFAYSFDGSNIFDREFVINSAKINNDLIGQRNFNYKIGTNNYSYLINNNIYSFWPDTRTKDGNVEIYLSSYPITSDINKFLFNDEYMFNIPYPNPTESNLNISIDVYSNSKIECKMYNYNGRLIRNIFNRHFQPGTYIFNCETSNLSEGTYLINLVSNKNHSTQKFVIKK